MTIADEVNRERLLIPDCNHAGTSGMRRLTEGSAINIKRTSHAVTAEVVAPEGGADGAIVAQGGAHSFLRPRSFTVAAEEGVAAGDHQARREFADDGGGLGKGATIRLDLDGRQIGEGRVEASVPLILSMDEPTDIAQDSASPVSDDHGRDGRFDGTVCWVQIDVDAAAGNSDHLITPEERLRVAMARQ